MPAAYAKISKALAAITLVSLIAHSKVLYISIGLLEAGGDLMTLLLGLGGWLYPVLGLLAVAGLWTLRTWGFYAFYIHLVVATLLFGISFIPFLPAMLPADLRFWAVIATNLLALIVAVGTHRGLSMERR
jgi:hypothetical protein